MIKQIKLYAFHVFLFLLSFNCCSQILLEKGYFINNSNKKTECFIKNSDWLSNPTSFRYALSKNGEIKKVMIKEIKAFGVSNKSKFIRAQVAIDKSSNRTEELSFNKAPTFETEEIFLKVLIEGKASLFYYEEGGLKRYFYSIDNSKIEQLVFKSYKTANLQIHKNNQFKQQLWNNLQCKSIEKNKINNTSYTRKSLTSIFVLYNSCSNSDFTNFSKGPALKGSFSVSLRPRFMNSSLSIDNLLSNSNARARSIDFGTSIGFGIGIEAETVLPFNKNKWALILEPTLQSYSSEKTKDVIINDQVVGTLTGSVDYKSIEIPFGIRHYSFLNNNSKLFYNISLILDFAGNSKIEFDNDDDLKLRSDINYGIGCGYKYKSKYALEIRYKTTRDVLNKYGAWIGKYNTLALIFGYTLF